MEGRVSALVQVRDERDLIVRIFPLMGWEGLAALA
jgi:hypothetical protein